MIKKNKLRYIYRIGEEVSCIKEKEKFIFEED